jgi:adenylate kinase family enzyme
MKIYIIGTSGSGKTTLARRLAQTHALRHISLDDLHWKRNWVESMPGAKTESYFI